MLPVRALGGVRAAHGSPAAVLALNPCLAGGAVAERRSSGTRFTATVTDPLAGGGCRGCGTMRLKNGSGTLRIGVLPHK